MTASSSKDETLTVAIFPLPNIVAFEGQQHLLHIFEPRYRQLIEDCIRDDRLVGLALAQKQISKVDNRGKSADEILKSNQSTYGFNPNFGAGEVKILRTLDDGRILIVVNIVKRMRLIKTTQSLPYYLGEVEVQPLKSKDQKLAHQIFDNLLDFSSKILKEKFDLFRDKLPDHILEQKDLNALLLKVMEWFRIEADLLQAILEQDYTEQRGHFFLECMRLYLRQNSDPEDSTASTNEVPKVSKAKLKQKDSKDKNDDNVITIDFKGPSSDS